LLDLDELPFETQDITDAAKVPAGV
jgi:hypothetical protein